ncbi:MAG: hypothetical protein F6K30_06705 [Cyanothece sp. SIO2G6]|nr:hypothetical protein [Cyanothece sp. SIO2G6]
MKDLNLADWVQVLWIAVSHGFAMVGFAVVFWAVVLSLTIPASSWERLESGADCLRKTGVGGEAGLDYDPRS